jgi:anti-sigma-K factor RskA
VSHYDEATLALLALGESGVTPDAEEHLSACEVCRQEVEQLGGVVAAGRGVTIDDLPVAPAPSVWDRITAELHGDATQTVGGDAPAADEPPAAAVTSLDERRGRRSRRIWSLTAAAAVGIIVGAGSTYAFTRSTPLPTPTTSSGQVTVAALGPLDDPTASGSAVLTVSSPTQRTVTVTVQGLPLEPGKFYEVWLMDPSNAHLVALGVLNAQGKGTYAVPPGLDLRSYSAVDVSLQPMNGSPLHSSNSAVRGVIAT